MTSPTGEPLGYPAYRCPFCHEEGRWYLFREGDAVVSWSCDSDLSRVLDMHQRDHERTRIIVTLRQNTASQPPEESE